MKEKIDRLIEVEERSIQLLKTKKAPYGAIQHHENIIAYLKAIKFIKRGVYEHLRAEKDWGNRNYFEIQLLLTDEEYDYIREVI